MARDAEATRQRLLTAARAEFARYGIAGARVDRIAEAAASNKAQIYHYFGSKDALFDAVWESFVTEVITETPIDVGDLPGFAADLADIYANHPELMRLVSWQRLERADDPPLSMSMRSIERNIDAIAKAQAGGTVDDRFGPDIIFSLILHLATLWGEMNPDVKAVVKPPDRDTRRTIIEQAMRRLLGQ